MLALKFRIVLVPRHNEGPICLGIARQRKRLGNSLQLSFGQQVEKRVRLLLRQAERFSKPGVRMHYGRTQRCEVRLPVLLVLQQLLFADMGVDGVSDSTGSHCSCWGNPGLNHHRRSSIRNIRSGQLR